MLLSLQFAGCCVAETCSQSICSTPGGDVLAWPVDTANFGAATLPYSSCCCWFSVNLHNFQHLCTWAHQQLLMFVPVTAADRPFQPPGVGLVQQLLQWKLGVALSGPVICQLLLANNFFNRSILLWQAFQHWVQRPSRGPHADRLLWGSVSSSCHQAPANQNRVLTLLLLQGRLEILSPLTAGAQQTLTQEPSPLAFLWTEVRNALPIYVVIFVATR
jgi:hypothetical protein